MVELSYPLVLDTIRTVGILVGIIYYLTIMRNNQRTQELQLETRQVQLYMDFHETRRSPEFQKLWYRIRFLEEWDNLEDYYKKFGPENNIDAFGEHGSLWQQYDGLGFLLKKKVIDLSFLDDSLKLSILVMWKKFETIIKDVRNRSGEPNLYSHFEFLVNELCKAGVKTPLEFNIKN
jgi:hypothetical protein